MTDPALDEPLDEEEDDGTEIVRAKWVMDDAKTLSEAAVRLRAFADYLEKLEGDGWQLVEPVADDYGHIRQAP